MNSVDVPGEEVPRRSGDGVAWRTVGRFGSLLFSAAIVGAGVETLLCSYALGHGPGPHPKIVQVIPWLPAIPALAYLVGVILILCGVGLLFRRAATACSIMLGSLMLLCSLAFDVPRHPDLMSAEWRTNVLEPITIGSLAWLGFGDGVPGWMQNAGRYLLALALVVFGIAHFQILAFIASLVPDWMPWHRFWAVFTGVAFVAAGLSFAARRLKRWAALCLGLMFAVWLLTIHLPPVLNFFRTPGTPQDPDKWSDVFIVAALWGGSWALTLRRRRAAEI